MRSYRITLTCGDEPLGQIDMKRHIFRGDSLWPLMFVKCFIQLTHLPNAESSYKFARIGGKKQTLIVHEWLEIVCLEGKGLGLFDSDGLCVQWRI